MRLPRIQRGRRHAAALTTSSAWAICSGCWHRPVASLGRPPRLAPFIGAQKVKILLRRMGKPRRTVCPLTSEVYPLKKNEKWPHEYPKIGLTSEVYPGVAEPFSGSQAKTSAINVTNPPKKPPPTQPSPPSPWSRHNESKNEIMKLSNNLLLYSFSLLLFLGLSSCVKDDCEREVT